MARAVLTLAALSVLATPGLSLVTTSASASLRTLAPSKNNLIKSSFVAQHGPAPLAQTQKRPGLAPLRGGAAAASASLSMDFVLKTLAPLMGGIISATMFIAPMPAVLKAQKNKQVGDLNLSPYPAQCGNCAAWLSYGALLNNYWIMAPNVIGLATGLFFTSTGYALGNASQKSTLMRSFVSYMGVIALALACALQGVFSIAANEVMGRMGISLLMIYYLSPLSTIAKVVKDKDSSSIDAALTVVGVFNGLFWGSYGLAISDIYVYGPNLTGAVIAAFTTLIWFLFRKK